MPTPVRPLEHIKENAARTCLQSAQLSTKQRYGWKSSTHYLQFRQSSPTSKQPSGRLSKRFSLGSPSAVAPSIIHRQCGATCSRYASSRRTVRQRRGYQSCLPKDNGALLPACGRHHLVIPVTDVFGVRPLVRDQKMQDLKMMDQIAGPDKNSLGDEIANVNFFTTISHTYFKIPKKQNLLRLTN